MSELIGSVLYNAQVPEVEFIYAYSRNDVVAAGLMPTRLTQHLMVGMIVWCVLSVAVRCVYISMVLGRINP